MKSRRPYSPRIASGPSRSAACPRTRSGSFTYAWRSSPYLELHFFPEWTLGVCVLVRASKFLFVSDTGGIVLDPTGFGLRRADRRAVASLMPRKYRRATCANRSYGQFFARRIGTSHSQHGDPHSFLGGYFQRSP